MTKITLTKARWQNFLSTGNEWTEIELNKAKTSLIVGPNGSGKSTFLDAICFGLFNRPFRNINKTQLINTITNKNCLVEVEFIIAGNNFKVVRGIKPNIFEIWKNDELVSQEADSKDYQEAFEKYVLRINFKSFCQVFVLGSAIFTPFMALPKGQRREIIEDLLDMRMFTTMNNLLKTRISQTEYDIYQRENEKNLINEKLKLTYEHIKEIQDNTEKAIQEKQERIEAAEASISELIRNAKVNSNEIEVLEAQKSGEDAARKIAKELSKINNQLQLKVDQINREIKFLSDNDDCPTCSQIIEPKFKAVAVEQKSNHLIELQEGLAKLELKYSGVSKQVENFFAIQKKIDEKRKDLTSLNINMNNLSTYIDELRGDIEKALKETHTDINKPAELEEQLVVTTQDLENLNEMRTLQGYAAVMLKDTGIKARIIKTYIPIINQLIAKYTSILDFFVDFQLNEEFTETIKSRFRDVFSYESFSEGEKMRLNLAILFTWRAIAKMRNSIDCNILVFDEVLDSSLDTEGVDNMVKLLEGISPDTRIFIISHKDAIIDKFERVITFEKRSNFSKIAEV